MITPEYRNEFDDRMAVLHSNCPNFIRGQETCSDCEAIRIARGIRVPTDEEVDATLLAVADRLGLPIRIA